MLTDKDPNVADLTDTDSNVADNPLLNRVPGVHRDRIAEAETTSIEMCIGLMELTIGLLLLGIAVYDILPG